MTPMMPPPPQQAGGGFPLDPSMLLQQGAPAGPADQGGVPPDLAALLQGQGQGPGGPGMSTDPAAILQALAQMAMSDQDQLAMAQQIEQQQLEEQQKQAMIAALQMMIQQLSQDAHVLGGPSAGDALPAPDQQGGIDPAMLQQAMAGAMGGQQMPPGVRPASGQPIPDQYGIPA